MLSDKILNFAMPKSKIARAGRQLFPHSRFSYLPLFIGSLLLAGLYCPSAVAAPVQLETDTNLATAGYFQLQWSWPDAPADAVYQLAERQIDDSKTGAAFKTIYQGDDLASVISGKANGRYEYQVRAMANADSLSKPVTSNVVSIEVSHHSLANAFGILSLGVVIFLAILITIFRGAKQAD